MRKSNAFSSGRVSARFLFRIACVTLVFSFFAGLTRSSVAEVAAESKSPAEHALLKTHCGKCHSAAEPEGDFALPSLGDRVTAETRELWVTSLDLVTVGEMPPSDESKITETERRNVAVFLRDQILSFKQEGAERTVVRPRRLNNREFVNSVSDVLKIEDVGTHRPAGNLLGDTLHEGFDTNGDSLGISEYHLEQYIDALRRIVDAVVLFGERPETRRYEVPSGKLRMTSRTQRPRKENAIRASDSLDFLDPRLRMYFDNFQAAPASGRYQITIRAKGVDRGYYDSNDTGVYDGDPIPLRIHLGDRVKNIDLPDDEILEIQLDEWIAAGTRIELSYPTDGLRLRGNGNFKFQQAIAHDHIQEHEPERYQEIVDRLNQPNSGRRRTGISHWSNWTEYYRGPRPRVFNAEIVGPIYDAWPPARQVALLGTEPMAENAESILTPIAQRAWRRDLRKGELDPIVRLVRQRSDELGDLEAIKEGVVAILASPSFLLINPERTSAGDRFATRLTYFLSSTTPSDRFREAVKKGALDDFDSVRELVRGYLESGKADEFLDEFPNAWLQLDRINFMAPDPDHYPHFHRKSVSDDMVAEVKRFFRAAIENDIPVPEMLTADYSYVNADLAKVYGLDNVPDDSKLRKYVFEDGRRGGLLGMGAFLTLTADSLGTSPIHRAVYVLENFMGVRPSPPPGDVEIQEPDVRQAKTIKEILRAHMEDETCASCHRSIDPYGYAFENYDPTGAWRERYIRMVGADVGGKEGKGPKRSAARGLPIDSSATFRNGKGYSDIAGFRELMKSDANQERFVRCFIKKLLIYANGTEPEDFAELEKILARSAENDYRIVETIAAVVDSPLFRDP